MATSVRCFMRIDSRGDKRHGMWLMTRPDDPSSFRGAFIHGSRNEVEAPSWRLSTLIESCEPGHLMLVKEITRQEVLAELEGWPEGREYAEQVFARHPEPIKETE